MKKLEELGISPAPWKVVHDEGCDWSEVRDAKNNDVTCGSEVGFCGVNDAPIIAAAPKLYECLREAVELYKCETRSCDKCLNVRCWIIDATAALAEAAGERGVK